MKRSEGERPIQAAIETARTNWAGNYTYVATQIVQAASAEDIQRLVPQLGQAKAVGTRHSFNHIADTSETQLAITQLKAMKLDPVTYTVTIGGGVTYGELAPFLDTQGFALHNLASLPHISVAGACATGTHGSGIGNGCLSTAVTALELVRADGQMVQLSRVQNPEAFRMAVVGLGALGVITRLTLNVVPTFQVAQMVYEGLRFDLLEGHLREIFGAGYSVSLFTDWQQGRATQAWLKRKLTGDEDPAFPPAFFGAARQTAKLHPLPNLDAEHCTEQEGKPGPWYERLPHFRLDYTPSAGAEIQTEYFVPIERGYAAIRAVEELREQITPHLLVTEFRVIAADDLPMSMCSGRDSLALHFTWKQEMEPVLALLPAIEAKLFPFAARPHWAKLFTMAPERVRDLFPRFAEFREFVTEFDPTGRFRNQFLAELFDLEAEI